MIRNIYLVDDDDAVRASLHTLLSIRADFAIRSFRSGDAFLERVADLDSGVLLLDYYMTGANGLDVLEAIHVPGEMKFATVVLTGEGNIALAVQAMKAGALDFVEKPYQAEVLLGIIDAAFSRLARDGAATAYVDDARAKIAELSPRELDVLTGLIDGRANKVIAYDLAISPRTVEIYRANMMTKLGVRSLPEALRVAFAAGLVTQP